MPMNGGAMVSVKLLVADSTGDPLSETDRATGYVPGVWAAPRIWPLAALTLMPAGRPEAANVRVFVGRSGSEADKSIAKGIWAGNSILVTACNDGARLDSRTVTATNCV